jgi:AFG3 family protein
MSLLIYSTSQTYWKYSEDMIDLLGKRPFSRGDDMDKWLDENRGEKSAPAPLEAPPPEAPDAPPPTEADGPMPTPAPIAKALDEI